MKRVLSMIMAMGVLTVGAHASDHTVDSAREAFEVGRYKEAIAAYTALTEQVSPNLRGEIFCRLALAHYRDQDDVAAFSRYLDALDALSPNPEYIEISAAEKRLYDAALTVYLGGEQSSSREVALKLKQTYGPIVADHPEYYQLNFIVCAAYANLGLFDEFFEKFYSSYKRSPNSYLALKTRGLLHLKLFERLRDESLRERQRQLALEHIHKASQAYPADASLYKLSILFACPEEKTRIIKRDLEQIIANDIKVSRADVGFFISEAMQAAQFDLARRFVDKARGWYQYSRVVQAAEQLLQQRLQLDSSTSYIE